MGLLGNGLIVRNQLMDILLPIGIKGITYGTLMFARHLKCVRQFRKSLVMNVSENFLVRANKVNDIVAGPVEDIQVLNFFIDNISFFTVAPLSTQID